MGAPLPRPAALNARLDTPIEDWPYLDESTLLKTSSRKVCMTCHFRHHAGVNCIPVLTCQLHQGLIAHGEHLTSRCQGWAPEVPWSAMDDEDTQTQLCRLSCIDPLDEVRQAGVVIGGHPAQ